MAEAVIVAAARTPIGRAFKGSLTTVRPDDLAAHALTRRAASLQQTAEDLEHAARSWRAHALR